MRKFLLAVAFCGGVICPVLFAGFTREYNTAKTLLKEKKYAEAENAFLKAEKERDAGVRSAQAVIGRAQALYGKGETQKAIDLLKNSLKSPSFGTPNTRAEACLELGKLLEAQKKSTEAKAIYDQGGLISNQAYLSAVCNYRLAAMLSAEKKVEQMEKVLKRVINGKYVPEERAFASRKLAKYLHAAGKEREALNALNEADKLAPQAADHAFRKKIEKALKK